MSVEKDERSFGHSEILESSKSLLDVSWLGTIQKEKEELTAPLYLPDWIATGVETAAHAEDFVKIRVDEQYYDFLIAKYPKSKTEVDDIEKRIKENKKEKNTESILKENLFFLWEREAAERSITRLNIDAIKDIVKKKPVSKIERSCEVSEGLLRISLTHGVSFVHLTKSSLKVALESLEKAIAREGKEIGPALKLRKSKEPASLFEIVLKSIAGITVSEVAKIKEKYKSIAEIRNIDWPLEIEGVKQSTLRQIEKLLHGL